MTHPLQGSLAAYEKYSTLRRKFYGIPWPLVAIYFTYLEKVLAQHIKPSSINLDKEKDVGEQRSKTWKVIFLEEAKEHVRYRHKIKFDMSDGI